MAAPLTAAEFARSENVSRETLAALEAHLDLLRRWQPRINLVGGDTLADPWRRHVLDSAQLFALLPIDTRTLVDLGSGAGFPGLVLAVLGVPDVHLVESDRRKAAFLREAARAAAVAVTVHARRIEEIPPFPAEAVSARALAPLAALCRYAAPFLGAGGVALFPKGRRAEEELTAAREDWKMTVDRRPSRTDPDATIFVVRDLERHGNSHA